MNAHQTSTAIVTGASRGIGAAIARRLALDGYAVVVNFASSAEAAEAVVASIRNAGGRAAAVRGDVRAAEDVKTLFDRAEAELGPVRLVVNNAGIMKLAPIAEMDDAAFDAMVAINLKGVFNVLREAARRLGPGGKVINLSTSQTRVASPTYGAYAATKAAVEILTLIFARELRGRGVTVNAIAPGPTATDLFLDGKSPDLIDTIARRAPLERLGEPGDIAGVASMLASRDGDWINGQTLFANGGVA